MRRLPSGATAAVAAIGVVLAAATPAGAAKIACQFDSDANRPKVKVLVKGTTIVRFKVDGDDLLVTDNSATPIPCDGGSPTTANTDQINVLANRKRGRGDQTALVEDPAAFVPGLEDEFFGPDEIEWKAALGRGRDDLTFLAGDAPDGITAGAEGVNMNVSGSLFGDDADYRLKKVDLLDFRGGSGDDEIRADGGDGTGEPWPRRVDFSDTANDEDILVGGDGDDHLAGGLGNDELDGGPGEDELIGAPGNDSLDGGSGNDELGGNADADLIIGGPGIDTARYSDLNGSPVVVSIGAGSGDDGGPVDGPAGARDEVTDSVENLLGEEESDTFLGDDDANVLIGGLGADTLLGSGGADTLRAKDGVADSAINCGAGAGDKAIFDAGLDPDPVSC